MELLRRERTITRLGKIFQLLALKCALNSWRIVVIIVQSGLKLLSLTVVAAGVEMSEFRCSLQSIRSHNEAIMCLFKRAEDRINILTWTVISMQLTETRLREWGTLEFTILLFLTQTTKRSCSQFRGRKRNGKTLKRLWKRFNVFYMASDLYLNIWSCWKTELQRVQVNQCQSFVVYPKNVARSSSSLTSASWFLYWPAIKVWQFYCMRLSHSTILSWYFGVKAFRTKPTVCKSSVDSSNWSDDKTNC